MGAMCLNAELWEMGECSRGGDSGGSGHLQLLKHQSDLLQKKVSAAMEALLVITSTGCGFFIGGGEGHSPELWEGVPAALTTPWWHDSCRARAQGSGLSPGVSTPIST